MLVEPLTALLNTCGPETLLGPSARAGASDQLCMQKNPAVAALQHASLKSPHVNLPCSLTSNKG